MQQQGGTGRKLSAWNAGTAKCNAWNSASGCRFSSDSVAESPSRTVVSVGPKMLSRDRASSSAEGSGRNFVGSRSKTLRGIGPAAGFAPMPVGEALTASTRLGETARLGLRRRTARTEPEGA